MDDSDEGLRVVIADDHHFFRDGLRGMLESDGMRVVGEAFDGDAAVTLVRDLVPDIAVIDLHMPGVSGLEALREIARTSPEVQTVVLTVSAADADVLAALTAGACGYLLKDTRVDQLARGIRQAAEGHMVLSSDVAQALIAHLRDGVDTADADGEASGEQEEDRPALTRREAEVLSLIVQGADNVAIGRELSISPHTVKRYVSNIFEKLRVHSRVQAAVYAVRAGLV